MAQTSTSPKKKSTTTSSNYKETSSKKATTSKVSKSGTTQSVLKPSSKEIPKKTKKRATSASTVGGASKNQKEKTIKHSVWEEYDFPVGREIIRWIIVAFSIILFISSFEQKEENLFWLKRINFGLFGWCGYVSVLLTGYIAFFIIPNIGRTKAWLRSIAVFFLTTAICGIAQIFAPYPIDDEMSLVTYYINGYEQGGGGLFGGIAMKCLYPWFGTVGTVVLLSVLVIIGIVILSEKSGIAFLKNTTTSIYDDIVKDMEDYRTEREAKSQQRRKKQEEQKTVSVKAENKKTKEESAEETVVHESRNPVPANEETDDAYVKSTVETIRKRVARKKELEQEQPLMEWSDTTEDTENHNPVDYNEDRDLYSNTSGSDAVRASVAGTRTVVTASGKVITRDSDEIPPATKKRSISKKAKLEEQSLEKTMTKEELAEETVVQEEKPYRFPSIDFLKVGERKTSGKNQASSLQETADILEQTFRDFGVGVTVTNYSCGPTVTRYELEPDHGVKVSRVTALADDIKLKLAATDIRIEAPIPGKAAIGIEVPNRENSTVMLRELLESDAFQKHSSKLAFAVGKDIGGKVIVFDIAKMPHVLIAGATGSGKSVCINTLIMSILYKAEPSEVKLIMIDPKVVELSVYNGIPHLLIPVVTDPKKAAGALNWAVAEMTRRYQLFAETATRDLAGYNKKARTVRAELEKQGFEKEKVAEEGPELLPQIVIVVDELADLMMVAPGEVEDAICRLAQMARAAGLHLVLATQRPSVNVITGLIKANVPSRIAFSVSSGVDSRTIIDMNGAEKLLGKGDMLFAPFGYNKPVRVQGAFVSDQEVANVVEFLKAENAGKETKQLSVSLDISLEGDHSKEDVSAQDEYFEKAAYFVIEKEKGSIGMLQRMFKVGFNRAARIMDQLAEAGVVGPEEGTKPRKILMTLEEFQAYMEKHS